MTVDLPVKSEYKSMRKVRKMIWLLKEKKELLFGPDQNQNR